MVPIAFANFFPQAARQEMRLGHDLSSPCVATILVTRSLCGFPIAHRTEAPGQGRVASASGGGADASRWPLSVGGGERVGW